MKLLRSALLVLICVLLASSVWALGTLGQKYRNAATTSTAYSYTLNSLTSGTGFAYSSSGTITGSLFSATSNTLTTGNFWLLTGDDDALTTGKYIKCLGGTNHATEVWSVGEGGITTITPTAARATGNALTIDGTVQTSGNLVYLTMVDGTNTTGTYIKCYDGAATDFSVGEGGATTIGGALTASSTIAQSVTNAAGGSANPYDYTATLGIMDGSDDFTLFDVNIANADHTGSSNTVQVLDIANITGDAHATETAVKIGTGWDTGITTGSGISCTSTLAVSGASTLQVMATDTLNAATADGTTAATYYGKTVFVTYSGGACTITLPANGAAAGTWFKVIQTVNQDLTITAATADTLITNGDIQADSVAFSTSSHKTGACVMLISNGTYWIAVNESDCTMTVAS